MSVWAILLAGGTGNRFGGEGSKLLAPLGGQSVFWHSVEAFIQAQVVEGLCIVSHPQWHPQYQDQVRDWQNTVEFVWAPGGDSRRESVWNGLQALPTGVQTVMVHDAARPLVLAEHLQAVLAPVQSGQAPAATLGVPVPYTIKATHGPQASWISHTVPRACLWQVNTPQVFTRDLLTQAHQHTPLDAPVTDDAELVERYWTGPQGVLMVEDSPQNLKITTPTDLALAELILQARLSAD